MEENRKKIMDQISAFCVTICLRDERRALEPGFEFQREHENYLNALTGALGRFLVCALWLTETFLTPTRPVGAFSLLADVSRLFFAGSTSRDMKVRSNAFG
jgi:hypothetical protein